MTRQAIPGPRATAMTRLRAFPNLRRLMLASASAALMLGAAGPAAAQYQWRDAQGRMVYSDLAPPTSIEPSQIIRVPELRRVAAPKSIANPPAAADATAATPGAPPALKPAAGAAPVTTTAPTASLADRDMAYRKRLAEQIEAEKKAAADQAKKIELAKACDDARGDIRLMESGQRVTRVNASGEREFLTDRERGERLAAARRNIGERC